MIGTKFKVVFLWGRGGRDWGGAHRSIIKSVFLKLSDELTVLHFIFLYVSYIYTL